MSWTDEKTEHLISLWSSKDVLIVEIRIISRGM